jgi:hypothetical protein
MRPPRWECKSDARVDAVYVMDMIRLAHLHGYASFSGTKANLLRDVLEEGSKATGDVETLTEEFQVPLGKIILLGVRSKH